MLIGVAGEVVNSETWFRRALMVGICLTPACSAPDEGPSPPALGSGGGGAASSSNGGATTAGTGGSTQSLGPMAGTASTTGGTSGASAGSGGAENGGSAGAGPSCEPGPIAYDLDCGAAGIVLEAHGPSENRINYIIVGDGYTSEDLETAYPAHLEEMLLGHGTPGEQGYRPGRFSPELEPYRRYRNFINICALKIVSATSGVEPGIGGGGKGCPNGASTALDGCGDDDTRLGYINNDKVYTAVEDNLPATIEMDWVAVVFNGSNWWNSGGIPMVWSGGNEDATLAAQHEGGHGFFVLADEYGGSCDQGLPQEDNMRVNVTLDPNTTADKWTHWLGTTQVLGDGIVHEGLEAPGTGMQQAFEGGQYCNTGVYRPSQESVMNSLWASYYHNSISLEKAVREIHELIDPIDSHTPLATTTPGVLEVLVIDPAVIKVEWSVDGSPVAGSGNCGQALDVAALGLASGSHVVTARAIDDTAWVPMDSPLGREDLEQTVEWTIEVP